MYHPATGAALVSSAAQNDRHPDGTAPYWASWQIQNLYHTKTLQNSPDNSFGNDYIAGGAGNDEIFGQLGNDVIQGDGSIDLAVGAFRDTTNALHLAPSVDGATDGNDYVEGGGGNDVIFGNQGQDDLVG